MEILQKQTFFTIRTCCVILVLLPYVVSSSQEHVKAVSNKYKSHKLNCQLLFEIQLHGFLLWASIGFCMPIGILTIRMSSREECGSRLKILFYVHVISQTISMLLVTTGAVMSIKNFDNSFKNNHQRMGVALYGVVWLQAFIGFLRPQRGSKGRSVWFFVHWVVGTALSLLGIINIYTGLQEYSKKASKSIRLWSIIFTCEVSFIVFVYLFQDKWEYIQKKGVCLSNDPIRPTDQETASRGHNKESLTEPYRDKQMN